MRESFSSIPSSRRNIALFSERKAPVPGTVAVVFYVVWVIHWHADFSLLYCVVIVNTVPGPVLGAGVKTGCGKASSPLRKEIISTYIISHHPMGKTLNRSHFPGSCLLESLLPRMLPDQGKQGLRAWAGARAPVRAPQMTAWCKPSLGGMHQGPLAGWLQPRFLGPTPGYRTQGV